MSRVSYININSNPCLNELVYSVLRTADKEDLLKLKGKFLKAAKTEKGAKFFAAHAKYEEKAALLAEFGVKFFTVFVNHENITSKKLYQILEKYQADQYGSAMDALSEAQMWVESDKQFIHFLGLMAQTSNHPSYRLNQEYQRAGYHAKKWTVSAKNKHDAHVSETIEQADYISKLMLHANLIANRSQVLFGVPSPQIQILIYLYSMRYTHVSKEKAWNFFLGTFTKQMISTYLTKLEKKLYAERHLTANPDRFTITSLGIGVVNRYMTTVFNQNQ